MNEKQIKLSLAHHYKNKPYFNNTVEVEISKKDKHLNLIYLLQNSDDNLLIPTTMPAKQCDNLWQHTCCEAFIACVNQPDYLEFNFSPSGEWAAYAFSDYRERTEWENPTPPEIRTTQTISGLQLEAVLLLDTLPAIFQEQSLELGISTVLEDKNHRLAYLALAHSQENPDFHRRDQWISL